MTGFDSGKRSFFEARAFRVGAGSLFLRSNGKYSFRVQEFKL